jgi:thiamine biosynthesis lipoprotein
MTGPGSTTPTRNTHVVHYLDVMGTVVTIDVYADPTASSDAIAGLVDGACRSLRQADDVFSTWKADSPMSRLRRGEITVAEAPSEVGDVLELCATARELSGGWFDPWALPGGVDPTGYVKGWAAQRALSALVAPFVVGAIVNAAGDIASFGGLGTSQPFRFGIVNPSAHRQLLCVVQGTNALATSGSYERGLHLIDPHTGSAVARVASASVSGADLGLADALATAVAVAGEEGLSMVADLDSYEAMIVTLDGTLLRTADFPVESL